MERLSAPGAVINDTRIACLLPLHASSSGLVLLAFGGRDLQERILAEPLRRYTVSTITDDAALRAVLAQVRRQGYACLPGHVHEDTWSWRCRFSRPPAGRQGHGGGGAGRHRAGQHRGQDRGRSPLHGSARNQPDARQLDGETLSMNEIRTARATGPAALSTSPGLDFVDVEAVITPAPGGPDARSLVIAGKKCGRGRRRGPHARSPLRPTAAEFRTVRLRLAR